MSPPGVQDLVLTPKTLWHLAQKATPFMSGLLFQMLQGLVAWYAY